MKLKHLFLAVILLGLINVSFSQIVPPNEIGTAGSRDDWGGAIMTGVPFLMIAPDSRAGALGDIGAATSADLYSQHWNPAKYPYIEDKGGFSLTYSPWLRGLGINDINLLYATGYYKIDDRSAVAASLTFFSLGEVTFRQSADDKPTVYRPNEYSFDASYSRKLTDNFSMAVTARFVRSDLTKGYVAPGQSAGNAAMSGAADVSMYYNKSFRAGSLENTTLGVGLMISNLGAKVSYTDAEHKDFLPANLRIGIAYDMDIDKYNTIGICADVNKLLVPTPPIYGGEFHDSIVSGKNPEVGVMMGVIQSWYDAPGGFAEEMAEWSWSLGAEYTYRNMLFARAGYFHESKYKGYRQYITFGLGLKFSVVSFDLSYLVPTVSGYNNPLKNTLRFSLGFNFGEYLASRNRR
jgi:hypothetical protein